MLRRFSNVKFQMSNSGAPVAQVEKIAGGGGAAQAGNGSRHALELAGADALDHLAHVFSGKTAFNALTGCIAFVHQQVEQPVLYRRVGRRVDNGAAVARARQGYLDDLEDSTPPLEESFVEGG